MRLKTDDGKNPISFLYENENLKKGDEKEFKKPKKNLIFALT
jgi:hypothetical protein